MSKSFLVAVLVDMVEADVHVEIGDRRAHQNRDYVVGDVVAEVNESAVLFFLLLADVADVKPFLLFLSFVLFFFTLILL